MKIRPLVRSPIDFLDDGENEKTDEKRYEKIDKLGEGTYGVIFKGREIQIGRIIALKRVKLDYEEEGDNPRGSFVA